MTPPALTVSPAALTADDPPLAGQLTTVVALIAPRVRDAVAPLMIPPLTARMDPALKVSLLRTPPDATVTVPPLLTRPFASVPPDDTISLPPLSTVVALAVAPEETVSVPPALIVVESEEPLA